jgi:hypothetical protein
MAMSCKELDPHGADGQGNPLGGIVYSDGFGMDSNNYTQQLQSNLPPSTQFIQVTEWVDFIGNGMFCLKLCNPSYKEGPELCNHIYDEIGCEYNAVADYANINGTFQVCDSDDMTPPGVYVTDGVTMTWFQPTDGEAIIPPYTPNTPSSSNCHTFSSEQLYGSTPLTTGVTTTASSSTSTSAGYSISSATPRSSSASAASPTKTSAGVSLNRLPSAFAIAAALMLFYFSG